MKHRSDRIIVWAIAVSAAIHLVVAFGVRNIRPIEAREAPTPSPFHITLHVPPPTPPPTPQPHVKPVAPTHPTVATRPRVSAPTLPRTGAPTGKGPIAEPIVPGPIVDVSPGPVITDSPKPACSVPNAPATTVNVVSPTTPDDAAGDLGTAQIRVTLTPSGAVSGAELYRSAGNVLLDRAAIVAAKQTTYRAAVRDCVSVGGSYLFTVNFTQ